MNRTVYHRTGIASCCTGFGNGIGSRSTNVSDGCGCGKEREMLSRRDMMQSLEQNARMEMTDQDMRDSCGCAALEGRALAMAYVPMQRLTDLYEPLTALCAGTLFAQLDKPFCGETVSASAYPNAPARTCDGCGCGNGMRGGGHRG